MGRIPAPSRWPESTRRAYHGITRGFVLNEIVRRVDPEGRTIGMILREDVVPAIGPGTTIELGFPAQEAGALGVVPLYTPHPLWAVAQSMVPPALGRQVPWGPGWCLAHMWEELDKQVITRTNLPFEEPTAAARRADPPGSQGYAKRKCDPPCAVCW